MQDTIVSHADLAGTVDSSTRTGQGPRVRNLSLSVLFGAAIVGATPTCTLVGSGSAPDPFLVGTYGDLKQVATTCNSASEYRLTADIDASASATENGGQGFAPIGPDAGNYFDGKFHGAGHVIRRLHIANTTNSYVGLFGYLHFAAIDSLGIEDANISGSPANDSGSIGALAGFNWMGTIASCHVTDTVTGMQDSSAVGGLVGYSNGTISDCHATVVVSGGHSSSAGGIAGQNEGTIRRCRVSGSVSGQDSSSIGGVVGYSDAVLAQDTSTARVSATGPLAYVGGLAGWSDMGATIDTAFAGDSVAVAGDDAQIGGLVGRLNGTLSSGRAEASVVDTGDNSSVGGVVGYVDIHGSVSSCSAIGSVRGTGDGSYVGGVAGYNKDVNASIESSWASGDVFGNTNACVGGVLGLNDFGGYLYTSYSTGTVVGRGNSSVGGVVGLNNAVVSRTYATGRVQGLGDGVAVGGVVGLNNQGTFSHSYATGSVNGTALADGDQVFVGGVVGYNTTTLSQVYAAGAVFYTGDSAASVFIGGVAGRTTTGIVDAYWNTQTTGQDSTQGFGFGSPMSGTDTATGLTTAQMRESATYTNFVFANDSAWKISGHKTYPALNGVVNAPFAFADSLLVDSTGLVLSSLAKNDSDAEAGTPSLVAVVDTLLGSDLTTFAASASGSMDSLLYRVGNVVAVGDTLWGGEAKARLEKVAFHFTLGADSLHTYGDAAFTATASVSPSFPVTFSSQNGTVAGVSGSQVQPGSVGTTNLIATIGDLVRTAAVRIAPKTLTITGAVAQKKVYDGGRTATVTGQTLSGKVSSDDVGLTLGAATFADKDVGTAKAVMVTGSSLTGTTAANYSLTEVSGLSADIVPDTIHVTALADSVEAPAADPVFSYTQTGLIGGDVLSGQLSRVSPSNHNVGTYAITLGSLTAGSNYAIEFTSANFKIYAHTTGLSVRPSSHAVSHELATKVGQAFAQPALGTGRAALGTVPDGENSLTVDLVLPGPGEVEVSIYDNLGALVISFDRDIAQGDLNALQSTGDGRWILPVSWNLRSGNGIAVPTGVYLWKIDIQTVDGQKLQTVKKLGVSEAR